MKKVIYPLLAIISLMGCPSCSKDDPEPPVYDNPDEPGKPDEPDTPDTPDEPGETEPRSLGVFIVNAGNMYSNIAGSLGYLEYSTEKMFEDLFSNANGGATVGDVFNSGYIYDDKIYLAVTNSAIVHVLDRETYKVVKSITTPSNAGPRQFTSYNGKVYVTLFGTPGYLAEIDPESLEITNELEVGPLPEYVVAYGDKLYVSVSDGYGQGDEACVAVIDPSTLSVTKRITGVTNPVNLATNGKQLYVCAWGKYMSEPPYSQYDYGIWEIKDETLGEKVSEGTYMSINGDKLYYYSDPYGTDIIEYGVLDTTTNQYAEWIEAENGVDSPIAIGSDPITGDVFILSYHLGEGGYASYNTPGYIKQYRSNGDEVGTFDTGISPSSMFFNVYE